MHSLLARQIELCTGPDGTLDQERFYALVSSAYDDDARARHRLERSITLMSEEMAELNAQIALEARQTLTRYILESRDALITLDDDNCIALMNGPAAHAFGIENPRTVMGLPIDRFLDPKELREGQVSNFSGRHSAGHDVPFSATFSVGRVDGSVFRIIALRDETERRAREAALEVAKQTAEHANEAKSSFLAMMSHELRTPLNALLGSAELMARTKLDETQANYVRMFNEAGRLMMAMVNDVLDYAKIEAGQLEIEQHPTSLRQMAREIETLWGPHAETKGLTLTIDAAGLDQDMVIGDPTRLRQIVFNLVSNAVKFTVTGGVTIRLRSKTEARKCHVIIEVIDTGVGIPADRQTSIFKAFIQADSTITRRFGGTGLGLAIAKSLAQQMQGDLTVTSQPGQGSTFQFEAHFEASDEQELVIYEANGPNEIARPLQVLAVDDNDLNRQILAAMLDLWPVETSWATNGVEALEAMALRAFDVVLMDVQMPVMDGLTATQRVRAGSGPNRDTPIIALTANARQEDRTQCMAAGMTDFVTKPISAESLANALIRATHAPEAAHADAGTQPYLHALA
ncbi:autoinducer 2 sensor kinase/phosphatase LuxQ [Candidatus Phycosocius bacilliformis]|uniref:histidine kinase n=1 Tax=Candidatus Phycosocius bacilliformis TaxID=1445552 RepID=A0A2P2E6F0_9PROT|nr:ATP-binding protein [Candidatus Phycosocius bacilliformis]GBF56627.1 autoinducer 2 sensor kinase/phosphatase LuxQ [Candidatus Phycosocius bacilliformis]